MINRKFGKLLCIRRCGADRHGAPLFECKCDCGTKKIVRGRNLRAGQILSCGCYKNELASQRFQQLNFKHGKRNKRGRLYRIWQGINQRCRDAKYKGYKWYGGRGIQVCQEWQNSYLVFEEWAILNEYSDNLQIDRIDNDGDYTPANCRWVSPKENARNKSNNRKIAGFCLSEHSEKLGASENVVRERLRAGWSIEKAISKPKRKYNRAKID